MVSNPTLFEKNLAKLSYEFKKAHYTTKHFRLICRMSPNVQKTICNHMKHIAGREIYVFILFDRLMIDDTG